MFETAVKGASITATMSKLARNTGSSHPGKNRRACTGSIWVASISLSTSRPSSRCLYAIWYRPWGCFPIFPE
jgi:hypothetical protein